jgi:Arginine deiminase
MLEIIDHSEFCTPPKNILLHHPRHGNSLQSLPHDRLSDFNFFAFPDTEAFNHEYDRFAREIGNHVEPLYLGELLRDDPDYAAEAGRNPNLMFTRDSSITLPWKPDMFIPARLALPSRAREPLIVTKALRRLGMEPAVSFVEDEFVEGGDVLPAMDGGKRILLVGFGVRTTKAAAMRLALELSRGMSTGSSACHMTPICSTSIPDSRFYPTA